MLEVDVYFSISLWVKLHYFLNKQPWSLVSKNKTRLYGILLVVIIPIIKQLIVDLINSLRNMSYT